jgi:hypothetical protein
MMDPTCIRTPSRMYLMQAGSPCPLPPYSLMYPMLPNVYAPATPRGTVDECSAPRNISPPAARSDWPTGNGLESVNSRSSSEVFSSIIRRAFESSARAPRHRVLSKCLGPSLGTSRPSLLLSLLPFLLRPIFDLVHTSSFLACSFHSQTSIDCFSGLSLILRTKIASLLSSPWPSYRIGTIDHPPDHLISSRHSQAPSDAMKSPGLSQNQSPKGAAQQVLVEQNRRCE